VKIDTVLSLESVTDEAALPAFDARVRRALPGAPIRYVCEPKVDSLGIALLYRRGQLVRGATTGLRPSDGAPRHATEGHAVPCLRGWHGHFEVGAPVGENLPIHVSGDAREDGIKGPDSLDEEDDAGGHGPDPVVVDIAADHRPAISHP
jgi:NAD-dependent DNA ligase-like protein